MCFMVKYWKHKIQQHTFSMKLLVTWLAARVLALNNKKYRPFLTLNCILAFPKEEVRWSPLWQWIAPFLYKLFWREEGAFTISPWQADKCQAAMMCCTEMAVRQEEDYSWLVLIFGTLPSIFLITHSMCFLLRLPF